MEGRSHGILVKEDALRSFPSGHASMAFLFLALGFVLPGWKGRTAFAAALAFGLLMSLARVCQGDHFPSDVLVCGALMYGLAAALAMLVQPLGKETQ
jgi:lipid A 4'-phosphatase